MESTIQCYAILGNEGRLVFAKLNEHHRTTNQEW